MCDKTGSPHGYPRQEIFFSQASSVKTFRLSWLSLLPIVYLERRRSFSRDPFDLGLEVRLIILAVPTTIHRNPVYNRHIIQIVFILFSPCLMFA